MTSPLVSIITPTYNHEQFIADCIESVLAQSYPNWEQIIIDDGSTDKTSKVILDYKDERIKYIRQDNIGIWRLGETYNKALAHAKGDFVAILEGDDFWSPYNLEKQISSFYCQDVVLSFGKAACIDIHKKVIFIRPRGKLFFQTKENVLKKLLLGCYIPASTVICRRSALLNIGGFKQPIYTPFIDWPTFLELSLIGQFIGHNEILGYHYRHEKQITQQMSDEIGNGYRCCIEFFDRLSNEQKFSMGITRNTILTKYKQFRVGNNFSRGREALIRADWKEARKRFKALRKEFFSLKLYAILELAFGFFKENMERITFLLHRPRVKKPDIGKKEFNL